MLLIWIIASCFNSGKSGLSVVLGSIILKKYYFIIVVFVSFMFVCLFLDKKNL